MSGRSHGSRRERNKEITAVFTLLRYTTTSVRSLGATTEGVGRTIRHHSMHVLREPDLSKIIVQGSNDRRHSCRSPLKSSYRVFTPFPNTRQ